jgi:hypothetical protein
MKIKRRGLGTLLTQKCKGKVKAEIRKDGTGG